MPPSNTHSTVAGLTLACAVLATLAACERSAQEAAPGFAAAELDWARTALERNPRIEVVASDAQARVFTIRDRQSGEVQVVKIDEIAAAPVNQLQASAGSSLDAQQDAAEGGAAPDEELEERTAARRPSDAPASPTQQAATTASAQTTSAEAGYTIDRTGGQLRVTGPGVSIVSSGQPQDASAAGATQRASEPIICEGRRMVHFDGREIYVEGDAITVRDGCEMFITNSRIVATGTGVTVRNGVVHISNSHIEGSQGSFDADAQAKLFVRSSTFEGLPRRDELALVQDQGGNRWR